jgi:hypothetical protein
MLQSFFGWIGRQNCRLRAAASVDGPIIAKRLSIPALSAIDANLGTIEAGVLWRAGLKDGEPKPE